MTTSANNQGLELRKSFGKEMQLHARYKQCNYFTIVSWDIKLNENLLPTWPWRDSRKCTHLVE